MPLYACKRERAPGLSGPFFSNAPLAGFGFFPYRGRFAGVSWRRLADAKWGSMPRRMLMALGALFFLAACAPTNSGDLGRSTNATGAPIGVSSLQSARSQAMLGRLIGHWVLTGEIAGRRTVHDVEAVWVLQRNYVRISEVSRERGADGLPRYEATIFIGWLEAPRHYVCIWLDNTEVASGEVTCSAAEAQDSIPLQFRDAQGSLTFANTFLYHADSDTWDWRMDNIRGNAVEPFGRVSLARRR